MKTEREISVEGTNKDWENMEKMIKSEVTKKIGNNQQGVCVKVEEKIRDVASDELME